MPTNPDQVYRDEAAAMVNAHLQEQWRSALGGGSDASTRYDALISAIASALAARGRVREGYVRLPDGRQIEVPSEHPRTADGVPAFVGMQVWGTNINGVTMAQRVSGTLESHPSPTIILRECWSTRASAQLEAGLQLPHP